MSLPDAVTSPALLTADAKNRALRTFLVNLATDVAVALVLIIVAAFSRATSWGDIQWGVLAFTLGKTLVVTAGSYVLRAKLDGSSLPTPLPPAPAVEPVSNDADTGRYTV